MKMMGMVYVLDRYGMAVVEWRIPLQCDAPLPNFEYWSA